MGAEWPILGESAKAEQARAEAAETLKLARAANLSDVASVATARTNLGLGTAATHAATDFDAGGLAAMEQARAEAAEATKATSVALTTETGAREAGDATEKTRAEAVEVVKAPLASPALTGSPTAPTQTAGDASTKLATTAFATGAVTTEKSRAETAESTNAAGIITAKGETGTEKTRAEAAEAAAQKAAEEASVPLAQKGKAKGVAELDSTGKLIEGELPSSVVRSSNENIFTARQFIGAPKNGELGTTKNAGLVTLNTVSSEEGVFNFANFAGQGGEDVAKSIIGFLYHHYTDGPMTQMDNVGAGDTLRLKLATNKTRRPDKSETYVGTGNYLVLARNNPTGEVSESQFYIDKQANFVWPGSNGEGGTKAATFTQNKADDGLFAFNFTLTHAHANLLNLGSVLQLKNDVSTTRANISSPSGQTGGMFINTLAGGLVLKSATNIVQVTDTLNLVNSDAVTQYWRCTHSNGSTTDLYASTEGALVWTGEATKKPATFIQNKHDDGLFAFVLETSASHSTVLNIAGVLQVKNDVPLLAAPTAPSVEAEATGGTFAPATYFWKITAGVAGGESLPSAEVMVAVAENGKAKLRWTASANGTIYKVYRATVTGGEATSPALVATLGNVTEYLDTGTATTTGSVPTGAGPGTRANISSPSGQTAGLIVNAQAGSLLLATGGTTRLTVGSAGSFTFADAQNLSVGTATGTKIGTATTQKLGLWNATPVVQPALVASPAAELASLKTAVDGLRTVLSASLGGIGAMA